MGLGETLIYALPELLLALGAMALLIVGVFLGDKSAKKISDKKKERKEESERSIAKAKKHQKKIAHMFRI
jgi:hypothetical protein